MANTAPLRRGFQTPVDHAGPSGGSSIRPGARIRVDSTRPSNGGPSSVAPISLRTVERGPSQPTANRAVSVCVSSRSRSRTVTVTPSASCAIASTWARLRSVRPSIATA